MRNCGLEKQWLTRLPGTYPSGTFSPSPDTLDASRRQYTGRVLLQAQAQAQEQDLEATLAAEASQASSADTDILLSRDWC